MMNWLWSVMEREVSGMTPFSGLHAGREVGAVHCMGNTEGRVGLDWGESAVSSF